MKSLISFFAVCLIPFTGVLAQKSEPVLINVTYKTVHVNDTNNRDKPLEEEMLLQLGQSSSKYIRAASIYRKPVVPAGEPVRTVAVVGRPLAVVNGPGITDQELFQYPAEGKMNITERLGMHNYVLEFPLPSINWQIGEGSRIIGGYKCQPATGDFAGRTYTAWFTTELAFRSGPWKLSGLPGLILEAEDSRKEVMFLFKDISKDSLGDNTASFRTKLVKVKESAFLRAKEAYYKDPAASMQAQLSPDAPRVKVIYKNANGNSVVGEEAVRLMEEDKRSAKSRNNNPVELIKE